MSSVDAKLGAGTIVVIEVKPDGGDYTGTYSNKIKGLQSLGAIGDEGEAKDKTCIDDVRTVYGAGLVDSPDMEIPHIYDVADTDQKLFTDACKAKKEMRIKVTWPNGVTGTFDFQSFGWKITDTTAKEWIMASAKGKQNTDVEWGTTEAEVVETDTP